MKGKLSDETEVRRVKLTDEQFRWCRMIDRVQDRLPKLFSQVFEECLERATKNSYDMWEQLDEIADIQPGEQIHLHWLTGELVVTTSNDKYDRPALLKDLAKLKEAAVTELLDYPAAALLRDCMDAIRSLDDVIVITSPIPSFNDWRRDEPPNPND